MSVWDIIRVPFGYLLEFLYNLTSNYGIAMILFAIIVKLILLPMSIKSKKSSMKMARFSPQLKMLERKYGDDKAKYQQAVTELYKEEGVSTFGGCLWSFVPLLILIPLYQVIRDPMIYMMHMSKDLSASIVTEMLNLGADLGRNDYYQPMVAASMLPEFLEQLKAALPTLAEMELSTINFDFFGLDLSAIPNWRVWTLSGTGLGLFAIPVVSGFVSWFSMWASQKMNNSVSTDEKGERREVDDAANNTMKSMNVTMPLISIWIGFSMPAAMSIYWITQGLLGLIQDVILTAHFRKVYDAEDAIKRQRAAEQAAIEAEKERIRAERRAKNPDGITENTSKKKLKAIEKANKAPVVEGKLTPEERAALKEQKSEEDLDPNRPYRRGRAYDPYRYSKNGVEPPAEETVQEASATETAPSSDNADTNK